MGKYFINYHNGFDGKEVEGTLQDAEYQAFHDDLPLEIVRCKFDGNVSIYDMENNDKTVAYTIHHPACDLQDGDNPVFYELDGGKDPKHVKYWYEQWTELQKELETSILLFKPQMGTEIKTNQL